MSQLFKGLQLLLADNDLQRKPLDEQAAQWRQKSERDIEVESELIETAKGQWLAGSVMLWLGVSLTALAVIADNLWEHSYNPSFPKIVLVLLIWVGMLFVLWLIAQMFDQTAGFARWVRAFSSRSPLAEMDDSLEQVQEALALARTYPDVLAYKQQIVASRRLRQEDIRIMRDMGRRHRQSAYERELSLL
ncbi:hypothetical protein SAMN05428989_1976 [Pseudoxanthomonas sp. GM95]|uniref:hypothetical protein n=1 Tax=Pseudoxanthomonas sp. GM95 TaxID=1881043 RepID=UPI0008AAD91D|nr:hypothetical protein [Pseudoxanthomonas sp. GM95]SEL58011.1 hypothetical protein SAMN05428989_1976 [Pseudoxanthomonas sp. GM95]